jgi:hypothetical protein
MMLESAITLIVGFALGYAVREWAFRQSHRKATPTLLKMRPRVR